MKRLTDIVKAFSRGIARSRVSLVGAMIVTAIFPFLAGAILYDAYAHIENTYLAALIYMVLGPIFIGGLVLVFLGLFFFKGTEEVRLFTLEYLRDFFTDPAKFSRMRRLIFFAVFLTGVNLFIFGLLGYQGYHYMESVGFCGQFCHTVMNPEYTAYRRSPHSSVSCVECHIGTGATWFVKSKISGTRQLFAVTFDTYSKPIETPVHGLRPARETCEECHRPEIFHGDKLVVKEHFLPDEKNTPVKTVLLLKVGTAGDRSVSPHGIHWHVAKENRITYTASDRSRMVIPELKLTRNDEESILYRTDDAEELLTKGSPETREMDCIDCHNRPTHIYLSPDEALDEKLLSGEIPTDLPFIKKMALQAVRIDSPSQEEGRAAIANFLREWYAKTYPEVVAKNPDLLQRAIKGVQDAYLGNVFPEMNITWNTYVSHLGHKDDAGCFRCHDEMHVNAEGQAISMDCDTCHVILAEDEENPEILRTLGEF